MADPGRGEGTIAEVLAGEARWCVVHGDCREVMCQIPDKGVDHILTDPPYSEEVHSRSIRRTYLPDVADQPCRRTRKFEFGFASLDPADQAEFAKEYQRISKRWILVFSDTETAHSWRVSLPYVRFGFWVKDRAMPQISGDRPGSRVEMITIAHRKGKKRWNGGGLGNVWQHPVVVNCNGHRTDRVHEAQKPETLILELLSLFTDPDDLVFDSHMGSGTTGACALRLGRRFIGCDIQEKWVDLTRERLRAEETGSTLHARSTGQVAMFGDMTSDGVDFLVQVRPMSEVDQ